MLCHTPTLPCFPDHARLRNQSHDQENGVYFPTKRTSDLFESSIVLTMVRHDLLELHLKSIDYPVEHVFVILNYATENVKTQMLQVAERYQGCVTDRLMRQCNNPNIVNFHFLANSANVGVAGSMNIGIRAMVEYNLSYTLFNGDDTRFKPNRLLAAKSIIDSLDDVCLFLFEGFASYAATRQGIKRIGPWDENFWPAYAEDCDIWFRAQLEGCNIYYRGGYKPEGQDLASLQNAFVDHGENNSVNLATGSLTHLSLPHLGQLVQQTLDGKRGRFAYLVRKWGTNVCEQYHLVLHTWRESDVILHSFQSVPVAMRQGNYNLPYNDSQGFPKSKYWLAADWTKPGAISSRAVNSHAAPDKLVWQVNDYIKLENACAKI